ncbi:glycoside hydrolase family 47 protein [Parathielavia hyrcaniae]|uniref:alpha-1,2-Mannosidase n=1 Tax=Parathielavia hyrcaniae TaxID=113614 RepID=A0AAN6T6K5_9PEZI|nr:glycoside hydrolase family 47 protein [Parathielavia hyrcaniae]
MNVRDPFNIRTGSLNRPQTATWKSNRSYNNNNNNTPNSNPLSPLQHIIRTAATATQSAAADIRDKAGEVVQSAQQALTEATAALDIDLEKRALPSRLEHQQQGQKKKDMSFAIPKNVPSFTNPQRQLEDHVWAAAAASSSSSSSSRQRTAASSVLNGVQDFIAPRSGGGAGLPMYKDKPYMYPPRRGGGQSAWSRPFHPESKTGKQMAPKGLGWIIIDSLDTLILMNMTSRLTHAREWLAKSLTWDQDQDVNTFETTIRMLGGLLSAHYLSTEYPNLAPLLDDDPGKPGEDLYLEKAKDLADRLMAAFDSPSGVPYASVNLGKYKGIISHADLGASSTAETTTLQLEFKYLAKLTGEKEFWDKAERVMKLVDDNGAKDGLVPIFISATKGKFQGENIRLGSRGDSYYEYLIKQYLQTNKKEPVYLEMWQEALQGVRKHLITYTEPSQLTIIGERPGGLGGDLYPKMDHLVCFMPGTIALAATGGLTEQEAKKLPTWTKQDEADMQLARELMQTCWGMYKYMATGLAAEITYFNIAKPPHPESAPHNPPAEFDPSPEAEWRKDFDVKPMDSHNLQRPETVESLFYMWRITGEAKYREWGWEMFKSFVNYTAVADGGGFTSLANANKIPPVSRDNMESFWLAETLKYFYLLFSPADLLPLDRIVLNTEAHPLPRFDMGPLFSTGWERKPRGDAEAEVVVKEQTA